MSARRTAGFTLLELMIALFLGILLSVSVVQLYGVVKQIVQRQEALMHIQETMQTSLFMMGQAIRSTGNMGSIKWQDAKTYWIAEGIHLEDLGLSNNQAIQITNREKLKDNPLIAPHLIKHMKPNTDVLWIVSSTPTDVYDERDIKVCSDCTQIELLKSNQASQNGRNCRKLTSTLYYVNDENNLYFGELNKNAAGQLEGLEDLKMRFIPGGVRIEFTFVHLDTRLEWVREWAMR